jgi:NADP-dependent 3-hydroxy acid dehydrogenase YdfG
MTSFQGKAVVITGAASGIGEALANAMAAQGARLLICDIDFARLEAVAQPLRDRGLICLTQVCDVAKVADLEALAERARQAFEGVDVLVNNAGVGLVSPVRSLDPVDAHWLIDINFWGVVNGSRIFLPLLQARPGSTIVNLSSVFAMISVPTQSMYNASKAAVRAFSDAMREEIRDSRVNVLCVHPGGIKTRIAEQSRLGDYSSMAASPKALHAQFDKMARTSAPQAAAVIVKALQAGKTRVLIGADARIGDLLFRLVPTRASAWLATLARRQIAGRRAAAQRSAPGE